MDHNEKVMNLFLMRESVICDLILCLCSGLGQRALGGASGVARERSVARLPSFLKVRLNFSRRAVLSVDTIFSNAIWQNQSVLKNLLQLVESVGVFLKLRGVG